jgi:endonuclease/exonuclease/phosphatase family metal-dependent hydrolase
MEQTSGVLALMGALLLGGGGESRLERLTTDSVALRSASVAWSKPLGSTSPELASTRQADPSPDAGRFTLLTYNVAGLPQLVSPSEPAVNIPIISPLLNHYDVALVQEDFSYHQELSRQTKHAYRTDTMRGSLALMPDGLNQFSRFSIGWTQRVRWSQCNGYFGQASDCLADKGFSFTVMTLAPGVQVDVYNLHAEAGGTANDVRARRANFEQLRDFIQHRSAGKAVLVAGDTNLRGSAHEDQKTLNAFLDEVSLTDACARFGCGEEKLDRVLFRSSESVDLDILGWWTDVRFVDAQGAPLSDHPAVGVEVRWRKQEPARPLVADHDVR